MKRISKRDDISPEYKQAIQKLEVILDNNILDSLCPDEFTLISNAERASVQYKMSINVLFCKRENEDVLLLDVLGTFQLQTPLWQQCFYNPEGYPKFGQVLLVEPLYTIPNPTNVLSATASVLLSEEEMLLATSESGVSYLDVEPGALGS